MVRFSFLGFHLGFLRVLGEEENCGHFPKPVCLNWGRFAFKVNVWRHFLMVMICTYLEEGATGISRVEISDVAKIPCDA